jgi:hypothetical protein
MEATGYGSEITNSSGAYLTDFKYGDMDLDKSVNTKGLAFVRVT